MVEWNLRKRSVLVCLREGKLKWESCGYESIYVCSIVVGWFCVFGFYYLFKIEMMSI